MSILIQSFKTDEHSLAVRWALTKLGVDCTVIDTCQFPSNSQRSTFISNKNGIEYHKTKNADGEIYSNDFKTIWHRRYKTFTYLENLAPSDQSFAKTQCRRYAEAVDFSIEGEQFWVNNPTAQTKANTKIFQLNCAKSVGLTIPDTLMSNSPEQIRNYCSTSKSKIIYKPFLPETWVDPETGARSIPYTSIIDLKMLDNDLSLIAAPGIYQPYMEKVYEVRLVVMGNSYIAIKIDSQAREITKTDFRISQHDLREERISIPLDIEKKTYAFMRKTGLEFGVIDFIVTLDDDYIFLEVNPQGQFLGYEVDGIPLLQCFCDFLIYGKPGFVWNEKEPVVSWGGFNNSLSFCN